MPHNFVMLFNGKEGSSSYMSHLGNHPQINVPMFEGLDWYLIKEKYKTADVTGLLPKAVNKILKTGKYNIETIFEDLDYSTLDKNALNDVSVGFKWRIWGDNEELIKVFRQNDVHLLNIQRRSFSNLVFSDYITSVETRKIPSMENYGSSHLQFIMAQASEEDKQEMWSTLKNIRYTIDPEKLWPITDGFLENYRSRKDLLAHFSAAGIAVHNLFYEDFADDPQKSLSETLQVLGLDYHPDVMRTGFQRVLQNDPRDMAENKNEILKLPDFIEKEDEWNALRQNILAFESANPNLA